MAAQPDHSAVIKCYLLFELNAALDTGKFNNFPIDDVQEAIKDWGVQKMLTERVDARFGSGYPNAEDWKVLNDAFENLGIIPLTPVR